MPREVKGIEVSTVKDVLMPNSVLLSTLNVLTASETLGVSQECRSATALLIAFMIIEISRPEVVLMMDCGGVHCSGVCTVPGNLLPKDRNVECFPSDGKAKIVVPRSPIIPGCANLCNPQGFAKRTSLC
jgi:hypothetical protein